MLHQRRIAPSLSAELSHWTGGAPPPFNTINFSPFIIVVGGREKIIRARGREGDSVDKKGQVFSPIYSKG